MRILAFTFCLLSIPIAAFSQTANGTITGTVTDATGAVVAGATVEVTDTDTGTTISTVTTGTGSYTAPNLQPGPYSVGITASGFKKYTRSGLALAAAQTLRVDATLDVGASTESVTVSAAASLLKTETGDVATNVTVEQLQDLPVLGIGGAQAGSSGVRNPFNSMVMLPGVNYNANFVMIVNGAPSNTAAYRVEGMDNTNHTVNYALQENQPSSDAIQEVAVQTSNYAAEFGQAGGGLFNITMKSGTNQYHGTGYEYWVNEVLNAGFPFSSNGAGEKYRPVNRRNDFGGTFGGPVRIPKIYNGTNKTFFFFSYEQYLENQAISPNVTVPLSSYRTGDFSAISPNGGANFNRNLGVPTTPIAFEADGTTPIFANEIFNPASRNGNFATPFANNMIPVSMITPFANAVQALIPSPLNGGLVNNYNGYNAGNRNTKLPSLKIDQALGGKGKISFYWGLTGTDSQYSYPNGNADGLPDIISGARGTFIHSLTERLNYDYTVTPTLLLHLGVGYSRILFVDTAPYTKKGNTFDCATLGIAGCDVSYNFPTINSTVSGPNGSLGGMQQMGNSLAHTRTTTLRPSSNANLTWIHGSHSFKFGGEVWFQGNITQPPSGVGMNFGCVASTTCAATNYGATALPYTPPAGLNGQQMGNFYANFLLGDAISTTQYAPVDARMGKSQWGVYAQDSWKATRKLTLNYGLRWDLATPTEEQYGRSANLGVNVPNPAVGGRLGAPIFQQTCNCDFMKTYKLAFGPRLGVAYQLDEKTVLRGGWGIAYGFTPDIGNSSSAQQTSTAVGINSFFNYASPTFLPQPTWPNFNPGQTPLPGQIVGFNGFTFIDPNAARPPRQNQWSMGVQRELGKDLVLDASYVANRGVWWPGPLGNLNQVSPRAFASVGLNPYSNPADNLLLSQQVGSTAVVSRIGNYSPYPGYATTNTLLNALRPFPQFSTIAVVDSPTGKTWYDSLQVKVTKRMSKGLQVNSAFTWSKAMDAIDSDIYNPQAYGKSIQATDQPFYWTTNILYQTQKYFANRFLTVLTEDWQVGALLSYGSGLPLTPPQITSTNNLGVATEQIPTGQAFFLKNPNCGCINPYYDQVLNPAAWRNPAPGTFGVGAFPTGGANGLFYPNFRQARRPQENFNFGRNFRIKERVTLSIRAEFTNIFNRTQIGNPSTVNPAGSLTKNGAGQYTGGFGVINLVEAVNTQPSILLNGVVGALYSAPRQGTLIARFTF
jgi:hypothetical protein